MGRRKGNYNISPQEFIPIMDKMKLPLKEQIRKIAKEKGLSAHTLVEIYLERGVKEYQTKGF